VQEGKVLLPGGLRYRVLALPAREVISLPVLKKLKELVAAGATVVGPKPLKAETLQNYPECDVEVKRLSDELWSGHVGRGRVIAEKTAREVLLADGVRPDFVAAAGAETTLDYIHRRDGDTDIYFVANRSTNSVALDCTFRVSGKAPELWNAVTGDHKFAAAYTEKEGRTVVPLDFDPCGSWFVVFREPAAAHPATAKSNSPPLNPLQEISGPWTVHFDPEWGRQESAQFDRLASWTARTEPGIKFYSGTATYEKTFDLPLSASANPKPKIRLDLGQVRELAEVKVNGKSCGIVWCPPFRADITDALKSGANRLEIEVVNFWPNRIIGDDALPKEQRLTRTNIRKLTRNTRLMDSGLLGPVRLLEGPAS
jgi:hypothetical protein